MYFGEAVDGARTPWPGRAEGQAKAQHKIFLAIRHEDFAVQ